MDKNKTNNGKKGGWLVGKRHYDKNGKPLGGIKAVVTDAGGKPVELEGGEVIINREASRKHWKELSRINQSAGDGVAIAPPSGSFDEDPEDNYEHGGKIDFNPNHVPSKMIVNYAKMIKSKHPEIWKLGGNIFGNEAFENLLRASNRGYWVDSEEWMYIKWRAYVARHAKDFRIEGVVAMLKWCDKVDKGWAYMKQLIEEKIEKIDSKKGWKHKTSKMKDGGGITKWEKKRDEYVAGALEYTEEHIFYAYKNAKIYYSKIDNQWLLEINNKIIGGYRTLKIAKQVGEYYINNPSKMKDGGRTISQTPAPLKDRIKGSKFNEKGSASTSSKASDIKFDNSTIKSIQRLIDEHNEEHPSKKITLSVAKAVVRRGMGAYSSSHRPTISGGKPNSRTAWGLARLKAFIYKAQTGKSKSGNYSQDNDLFEELGISVQKMAKGGKAAKVDFHELKMLDGGKIENNYKYIKEFSGITIYTNAEQQYIGKNYSPFESKGSFQAPVRKGDLENIAIESTELKNFNFQWGIDNWKSIAEKLKNKGINKLELFTVGKIIKNYELRPLNQMALGGLIAPNGKPSNLTPKQYKLVRTTEFKAWFGDWENDPENASKVIDENGEPMVVYHGTNQKFTVFSLDKVGSNVDYGMWGSGFYFSPIKSFSKGYGSTLLKIFLNIRNPFVRNPNITGSKTQFKPVYGKEESLQLRNEILSANYDGVMQYESGQKNLLTQIIAFEPTQIKLADGTNTTFDGNNPDIQYKDGGRIKKENKNGDCYVAAGRIAMGNNNDIDFQGTPYLVHAQVEGQGAIKGIKYGHAWIEDDYFVYDYSNNRNLVIPKELYYSIGNVTTKAPYYYKYNFKDAVKKMTETGHYGSWDLETESGL